MRIYTYMVIMVGIMVMLTFFGFSTGSNLLLTYTGLLTNPNGFQGSIFYASLSALLILASGASLIIGLFTKQSTESFQVAAMTTLLASFIFDIISILGEVSTNTGGTTNWIYMIAAALIIPFSVGYVVSLVEWWRGAD